MASPVVEFWLDAVEFARGSIPAAFILGLIERLSNGNAGLIGPAGGRGLLQIHPDTAAAFGATADDLLDPAANIEVGSQLIETRGAQLVEADPTLGQAERGADLGRLTMAAFWFGPAAIIAAINRLGPGATAAQVLGQPGLEQAAAFVGDLEGRVNRIDAELAGVDPPAGSVGPDVVPPRTGPTETEPPTDLVATGPGPAIGGRRLLWIVGLGAVAVGAFFLLRKGK
jgi:hypothetical protein